MNKYIDCYEAVRRLQILARNAKNRRDTKTANAINLCADFLENEPAAKVKEVVEAEWRVDAYGNVHCSNCLNPGDSSKSYCSDCGAEMKEVQHG